MKSSLQGLNSACWTTCRGPWMLWNRQDSMSYVIKFFLDEYLTSPLWYSLGAAFLGLVAQRLISWFCRSEDQGSLVSAENGLLSDMVLPARCLRWRFTILRGRWHTSISSISNTPASPDWKPILVFGNKKSGSNQGADILAQCHKLLNPIQVHDLGSRPPSATLELCQLLPDTKFTVLVCGGDGSINWVLTEIDKLNLKTQPSVGILPLGTGNDLSYMLGWGNCFDDSDTVENFLTELRYSCPASIDRWDITVDYGKSYLGWRRRSVKMSMTNYFSIGCDALIALNFHKQRQRKPFLFAKRSLNKLLYFGYGAMDVLEQLCKNLNKHVELWLDGRKIDLPELEGLLFLNISYWGGGCRIWDNMSEGDQSLPTSDPGDGLIEVMGFSSSLHMAQIQVKLADPIRLGQARKASIVLKTKVPAQADGEPWEQDPCRITITFRNQAALLIKNATETSDYDDALHLETS